MPRIRIENDIREVVAGFLRSEGVSVEIVSQGDAAVRIVRPEKRAESDGGTLRAGGWVKCQVARDMAANLGMSTESMGRLLDLLNIKVRECGLGCF